MLSQAFRVGSPTPHDKLDVGTDAEAPADARIGILFLGKYLQQILSRTATVMPALVDEWEIHTTFVSSMEISSDSRPALSMLVDKYVK